MNPFIQFFLNIPLKPFFVGWIVALYGLQCTFIELRLYPPNPSKKYTPILNPNSIVWKDETNLGMDLGYHKPFLFSPRPLPNRYGRLVDILDREIQKNIQDYPSIQQGKIQEIRILQFELQTKDSCIENKTSVLFVAEFVSASRVYDFHYYNEIFSHVTDCFLLGSAFLAIPLVIYTPYVGFRGNREDQLNLLGRNAIAEFLKELKEIQP